MDINEEEQEEKPFAGPHDLRFPAHSKIMIVGSSGGGKTTLCYNILKRCEELMINPPKKIYYFYAMEQPIFKKMKEDCKVPIEFIKNIPTDEMLEEITNSPLGSSLICLDDHGLYLNKTIANLFAVSR